MQLGTPVINLAKDNILASGLWLTYVLTILHIFTPTKDPYPVDVNFK